MVSRYANELSYTELAQRYGAEEHIVLDEVERDLYRRPGYNLDGGAIVPVLVPFQGKRLLVRHWWGILPRWSRWPPASLAISIAASEAWDSRRYGVLIRQQRCIMPATRFYIWMNGADQVYDPRWQPWAVERVDGQLLSMAGIWAVWREPEGGYRMVCCAALATGQR